MKKLEKSIDIFKTKSDAFRESTSFYLVFGFHAYYHNTNGCVSVLVCFMYHFVPSAYAAHMFALAIEIVSC